MNSPDLFGLHPAGRRRIPEKPLTNEDFQAWLLAANPREEDQVLGLEAIAWAHWLSAAGTRRAGPAQELPELLAAFARQETRFFPMPSRVWLAAELPLTLATISESVVSMEQLDCARMALGDSVADGLNIHGWSSPESWRNAIPLLATWTRCGWLCRALQVNWLDEQQLQAWNAGLRQLWRAAQVNSNFPDLIRPELLGELLAAAVDLGADQETLELLQTAKRGEKRSEKRVNGRKERLVSNKSPHCSALSDFNEPAQFAMLRDCWDKSASQLLASYRGQQLELQLRSGAQMILEGAWQQQIWRDGVELQAESDWEHVCWHTDEEGDYLELELAFPGCRLQRQLVLSRKDRFAFLADSLLGEAPHSWRHRLHLTLAPDATFTAADATREGQIRGRGRANTRWIPAAIPEWREDRNAGELRIGEATDHATWRTLPTIASTVAATSSTVVPGTISTKTGADLILEQEATGRTLYAPLFVDLDAGRAKQPVTWRRLTVAEQLTAVPSDVAVAYRVQVGSRHWFFYREFGQRGNRTFFGKNACCDFFLGRFVPTKKDYETIVEIE